MTDQATPAIQASDPVIEDVTASTNEYVMKNDKKFMIVCGILMVAAAADVIREGFDPRVLIIPAVVALVGYYVVYTKMLTEFTEQFGDSIGFDYTPAADISTVSGRLFSIGHAQRMFNVLSGILNDRPSRIFSYQYTIGSGRDSETFTYTVFETTFANMMPDIVLVSSVGGRLPRNPFLTTSDESVQLEGDFNKYFSLTVPKGHEVEAFEIFPPNVMADLIDRAAGLNFEFNGSRLYIYRPGSITVRSRLQAMLDLAEYLDGIFSRSTRAVGTGPSAGSISGPTSTLSASPSA